MVFINGFVVFSLITTLSFLYGLLLFVSDYGKNKCEMTYMFEYPQFVRISLTADNYYKKYGLYAYSEGRFTGKARNMDFNGIPVLFIPGNAGSYKQVRSLASIALRKALDSRPGFHFDYFTIDFNEELSGLNGALLSEQMQYVNHSIYRILELYSKNSVNVPTSVILFGHSMGGVIAEGLISTLPKTDTLIPLVVTLASPHTRLPAIFDIYSREFYNNIEYAKSTELNTTFISLSGGYRDLLVPPSLTKRGNLNVITTHVPKTWLPIDHLCIVWCKQLVLALNRALFDCIDPRTKQISLDHKHRLAVFNHHLIHNSGIKRQAIDDEVPITIDNRGEWIEHLPRQYSVHLIQGTKQTSWYMVRFVNNENHRGLTILALNLEVTDWIYTCSAVAVRGSSRVCEKAVSLSHLSEIAPTVRYKRRLFEVNMKHLHNNYSAFSHVVAKVLPTSEPVVLYVDVYNPDGRKFTVNLPHQLSLRRHTIIEETVEKAIHYQLLMPQLYHISQAYQLFLEPTKCTAAAHHATASLIVPWGFQDVHGFFIENEVSPMDIRLHTSKPLNKPNSTAYIKLLLDPSCRYKISIKSSIPTMFSQLARFYSPFLIANVAAAILLVFKSQIDNIATKERCSLFFTALKEGAKPYYILPAAKILSQLIRSLPALKLLPVPDWQIIHMEGLDLFWLPIFLYLVSCGFVWILAISLSVSIIFFESTVQKMVLKLLSKTLTGTFTWSDWLIKLLHKLPGIVACMLVILSVTTCGGVALCLGTVFYFLKLTQMSQDILEDVLLKLVKSVIARFRKPRTSNQANIQSAQRNTPEESQASCSTAPSENVFENKSHKESNELTSSTNTNEEENVSSSSKHDVDEAGDENNDGNGNAEKTNRQNVPVQENNVDKTENSIARVLSEIISNNGIFFHFTIFLLWILVTCLNVPSVLTWAHNFKYNPKLEPDPSLVPGVILCLCAFPLWQFDYPKVDKKWFTELSYVLYSAALISLIYGTISLYRLNFILTSIIAIITLHQLFAPKKPSSLPEDTMDSGSDIPYDKVKQKWQ